MHSKSNIVKCMSYNDAYKVSDQLSESLCSRYQGNLEHHGDFHYLNCLHSYRTGNKLNCHEKACKKKDFVEL